jgi:hypothetical protein
LKLNENKGALISCSPEINSEIDDIGSWNYQIKQNTMIVIRWQASMLLRTIGLLGFLHLESKIRVYF